MDRAADEVERRQAALQESEERYRALLQATAAIEWRADPDGSMHEAPLWAAYTGQPFPTACAARLAGHGASGRSRQRRGRLGSGARGGSAVDVEYRVLHAASGDLSLGARERRAAEERRRIGSRMGGRG